MEDIKIKCIDCGEPFIFTTRDQQYYEEKGFVPPKRCRNCRAIKKDRVAERQNRKYLKF